MLRDFESPILQGQQSTHKHHLLQQLPGDMNLGTSQKQEKAFVFLGNNKGLMASGKKDEKSFLLQNILLNNLR